MRSLVERSICLGLTLLLVACGDDASGIQDTGGDTAQDAGIDANFDVRPPCEGVSCSGHGTCEVDGADEACACDDGYDGDECESCADAHYRNDDGACVAEQTCDAASCNGNGTCDDTSGSIECLCEAGYSGPDCAECDDGYHLDLDSGACVEDEVCEESTCGDHGTCDDTGGVIVCACDTGYDGGECDACYPGYHAEEALGCVLDETCLPSSCAGNGTCDDTGGVVACECDDGYAGPACATCDAGYHAEPSGACVADEDCDDTDVCGGHGTCDDAGGVISCTCDDGYAGALCDTCYPGFEVNRFSGVCEFPCPEELTDDVGIRCDGQCVRADSGADCGGCGIDCGAGFCDYDGDVTAACVCPDDGAHALCDELCRYILADGSYCGGCGTSCDASTQECYLGGCEETVNTGLLAYYPFHRNADDATGNGNHGIVIGAELDADRFGVVDSAYRFDQLDDRIVVPESNHPTGEVTISYAIWVYPFTEILGTAAGLLAAGDVLEGQKRSALVINPLEYTGEGNDVNSGLELPLEQWSFIVVTKDERAVRFYVNGQLLSEGETGEGQDVTNTQIVMGLSRWFGPGEVYEQYYGLLDDVRVYDRPLTEEEVGRLYRLGGWDDLGTEARPAESCLQVQALGYSRGDGNYWLDPDGDGGVDPFEVYCLMDTAGGGWTQLQAEYSDSLWDQPREYLYELDGNWYRSPVMDLVWSWDYSQWVDGAWFYGGFNGEGAFDCLENEPEAAWGVGCSNGPGAKYKVVLPDSPGGGQADPVLGRTTVCQDQPDVFQVGACTFPVNVYERRTECPAPSDGNLVADGEFDASYFCWWANGAESTPDQFRTSTDHPDATAGPSLRVENNELGNVIYDTQLFTIDPITMSSGTSYRLSFWAKAEEARTVDIFVQECCAPTVHFFYQRVSLTTEWAETVLDFVSPESGTAAYLEFQFGEVSIAPVWLDGISLREP